MILITTTSIVVVAFAIAFGLGLALMCKKDLFGFQLKFLVLLADLVESLLIGLVVAIGHLWWVVVRVVMAKMLKVREKTPCVGREAWHPVGTRIPQA